VACNIIFEILFGLIMLLTFTCTVSGTHAHRDDVRRMLFAALGCNLAWGIIDAVFYLLGMLSERGHILITLRAPRMRLALPMPIESSPMPCYLLCLRSLSTSESGVCGSGCNNCQNCRSDYTSHATIRSAQSGCCCWCFFIFFADLARAMRVSNGIAIVMLFLAGYAFGDYAGYRPLRVGLFMVVLGVVMVALMIFLGG
jgi:hypothetical protein